MGWYDKTKHAVRFWLLRKLPPCKETVMVISQSFERKLSLRERVQLKLHLWVCMWCQWYMEHLQIIRNSIHERGAEFAELDAPSTPGLSSAARERIKQQLISSKK